MRLRWCVLATALVLVVTACGGGSSGGSSSGGGLGGATTTAPAANSACKTTPLKSTEVGVTATTITVTVVADVINAVRPGLFKGSWDGVKAWGDYMNSKGGLACRKVVVKEADSKLSPTDANNAVAAACGNSVALVGTTALFFDNVSAMNNCKDKAGKPRGLPDLAELQTEVGAAVFAGLVRDPCRPARRARTAAPARAPSTSATRRTTTTSTSTARTRCTACS